MQDAGRALTRGTACFCKAVIWCLEADSGLTGRDLCADSVLSANLNRCAIAPHTLHISQQLPKKRMPAKRGRIAHQQQLAPCAGHAHVHAADVRQKADLALGVAARQCDGDDVALLALKRIDRCPRRACVAVAVHAAVKGTMHTTTRAPTARAWRWTVR